MYFSFFRAPFFILLVIAFTIHHIPTSLCQVDPQYAACEGSFKCANFQTLGYPFWGGDRAAHCGHPSFQLNCRGDIPLITFASRPYRVLGIDSRNLQITVARQDLWNNTCPSPIYNTSLDYRIFKHPDNDQNLTLSYGCSDLPGQQQPFEFDCQANGGTSATYFLTIAALVTPNANWLTCGQSITVPVNQTSAQQLTSPTSSENDLQQVLAGGFGLKWDANETNCNECARSGGRCGYNSNTTSFVCYCFDRPSPFECNKTDSGGAGKSKATGLGKIFLVVGPILLGLVIFVGCLIILRQKKTILRAMVFLKTEKSGNQNIEAFMRSYVTHTPQRYSYSDIKKMTNSFKEKLGQGGYGGVFKGKLSDGRLIAVKVLNETKGDGEDFINEVASISRTSHINVVTLLGFCFERSKRALIYEFMPNKSLDKFIYPDKSSNMSRRLDWSLLYQISIGIARGLEYLHSGCNTRIVHFDIKPQNILLDEDFCPKISDFGLAKLCKKRESIISMLGARGTAGYIAPEVFSRNFGRVSHKSDVYSYGMMVLEMAGGSNKTEVEHSSESYFPERIYENLENEADIGVDGVAVDEEERKAVRKMILVSLWCIQTIPADRPSMSKVVEMLEATVESLQIPPKPLLHSPTRTAHDSSMSQPLSSTSSME